jgi:hypothetical protein
VIAMRVRVCAIVATFGNTVLINKCDGAPVDYEVHS